MQVLIDCDMCLTQADVHVRAILVTDPSRSNALATCDATGLLEARTFRLLLIEYLHCVSSHICKMAFEVLREKLLENDTRAQWTSSTSVPSCD